MPFARGTNGCCEQFAAVAERRICHVRSAKDFGCLEILRRESYFSLFLSLSLQPSRRGRNPFLLPLVLLLLLLFSSRKRFFPETSHVSAKDCGGERVAENCSLSKSLPIVVVARTPFSRFQCVLHIRTRRVFVRTGLFVSPGPKKLDWSIYHVTHTVSTTNTLHYHFSGGFFFLK